MDKLQQSGRVSRSNYDRLSRWYDRLAAGGERKAIDAALEMLGVQEGDSVLEIGCGTGQVVLALARAVGDSGKIIGVDLSRGMLSQARARLGRAAHPSRSILVRGNAIHLPLQGGLCDAVFMSFTLELFHPGDIVTVLSECWRVLKHNGRLCTVAMAETADLGLMSRAYGWANRRFPEWIDCRPIDVQNVVSQAGFQIQDGVEIQMWGLPVRVVLASRLTKSR